MKYKKKINKATKMDFGGVAQQGLQGLNSIANMLPDTAGLVGIASGFANILDSNRVKEEEMARLRRTLTPVTSPNNFNGIDMPLYAKSGAVVTNYGFNEPIPGITEAQQAALNIHIPYTGTSQQEMNTNPVMKYNSAQGFMKGYGDPNTGFNSYSAPNYSGQMWADPSNFAAPLPGQFDPYGAAYLPAPDGSFRINTEKKEPRFAYNTGNPYYMQDGGSIKINPKNKGKFTESANKTGMDVQEFASHVLANKDDYSSTQVKRANFAKNASKWHEDGGLVNKTSDMNAPNINSGFNTNDFIVPPELANVVAENGEMIQFPDGSTSNINGDSHSDPSGGEYLNLPESSRIYSDKIRADKDFASDLLGKKVSKKYTISDLAKKYNTDKDSKILNNATSSDIQKKTASINKELKSAKLNEIFQYQEMIKNPQLALGDANIPNTPMAANGYEIPPYTPYVPQGFMDGTNYINPVPTLDNYMNPRWLFQGDNNLTPVQNINNVNVSSTPDNTNNIVAPNYNIESPQQARSNAQLNSMTPSIPNQNLGQNRGSNIPNRANKTSNGYINTSGGFGDYIPELFGAVQALRDNPIFTAKYQPVYNRATELNVQDALNRNYSQASQVLNNSGNPSLSNARANQTLANLYDANNQIYSQKYNADLQSRQQTNQANNQLENQANQYNLQRIDDYSNKSNARQANKERDLNTIMNSAYAKAKQKQLETRSLDLINQVNPNFKYNNNGLQFVPMLGPDGKTFYMPNTINNGLYAGNPNDDIETTETVRTDPKTGKQYKTIKRKENPRK